MKFLRNVLSGSSYFMVNKTILKKVGVDEAILLSCLVEAEEIFENEWFFQTVETIEELTTLTEYRQNKAIKNLEKLGVLEKKLLGMPAKRHFRINIQKILEFLQFHKNLGNKIPKNLSPVPQKFREQDTQKFGEHATQNFMDNKYIIYKDINNKDINNKSIEKEVDKLNVGNVLKDKLKEFIEFRKEIKKPFKTTRSIKQLINSIGKTFQDEDDLIECINNSIMNGYQGVFPNKNKISKNKVKKISSFTEYRASKEQEEIITLLKKQ